MSETSAWNSVVMPTFITTIDWSTCCYASATGGLPIATRAWWTSVPGLVSYWLINNQGWGVRDFSFSDLSQLDINFYWCEEIFWVRRIQDENMSYWTVIILQINNQAIYYRRFIDALLFVSLSGIYISSTLENMVFQLLNKSFTKKQRMISSFHFYKI